MTKKELRAVMRSLENAFSASRAREECLSFWARVEADGSFAEAGTVLLYMAIDGEIPTEEFISKWHGAKRIALPVVCGENLILREYSPDTIIEGYRGIKEPGPSAPEISASEVGYAVIPGVAFAFTGKGTCKRLGRGKGFYDRLLPHLRCRCIPAGWSFRFIDDLPTDALDAELSL